MARRWYGWLASLMVLMLTAGPLWPTAPVSAQAVSSPFGINSHVASRYGQYKSQDIPLDLIAMHNVSWVREEFRWDVVHGSPGRWNWGFTDELVDKATARGISILGLLVYSVGWANPSAGVGNGDIVWGLPENLDAYREYVSTVVSRYRGRVRAWEVWNEPNHDHFWRPQPNPDEYATLLRVASEAIRAADPGARVVMAGVSGSDIGYLERVIATAGWDTFDIVAAHPYVAPKSPERGMLANGEIAKLRAFVERHGGNKPIWLTEIGWPTSVPGHWGVGDAGTQANYVIRGMVQATTSPGVERAFWYNWRDDGTDPTNDENNFGLVAHDWRTPKPSATALRTLTRRLDNASFVRRLDVVLGARTVLNDFEAPQDWHVWGDGASASVSQSADDHRSGALGGRIQYAFTNGGKAYVDVQNMIAAPGEPQRLGVWVRGDSSGHLLWATFRDANDEFFRVFLCALAGGWQECEAPFGSFTSSDGDGVIQYPVRFQSLIIDNEPDGTTGEGAIVVDDIYVEDGPEVFAYRYARADRNVDVIWTVGQGAEVWLPTQSWSATVTNRDGQNQSIQSADSLLPLLVGESPIFVEHVGTEFVAASP